MQYKKSSLLVLLAGLLVVVGLPLAGKWARRAPAPRCAFDGLEIEALYRVRVVDQMGPGHSFCCVRCAGLWLARQADRPSAVHVTDEASGAEIDAGSAFFVQSTVVTHPVTRNRIHVFRNQADADEHLRAFGGWMLTGAERPFALETEAAQGGMSPSFGHGRGGFRSW